MTKEGLKLVSGFRMVCPSLEIVEAPGNVGFHFVYHDREHSTMGEEKNLAMIRTARTYEFGSNGT